MDPNNTQPDLIDELNNLDPETETAEEELGGKPSGFTWEEIEAEAPAE